MASLAQWLEANLQVLIEAASAELSTDETLRSSVVEAVIAFYEALHHAALVDNPLPVNAILVDWVEARSAPTEGEPAGLMPVLATLKRVVLDQMRRGADAAEAIDRFIVLDRIFSSAANFLASLEAEALLNDVRRELEKAQTHVEQIDKSKTDFIAVAAHELKTPLTLIEGYTNMLRADLDHEQHPHESLMLSGIASGTTRLKEIIDDMIDVSLIDMRMLGLHFQPVWIHALLQMVEFELAEPIRQRKLELIIKQEAVRDKPTYGDPERLHQVFQKVIYNAVKYTPDGGTITVTARELPGFTDVMVCDSGIGIAPENLRRIFDKFSSMTDVALHSSGKVKYRGAGPGLGLAIAKGVIEAHGGSIWAESPGFDEKQMPGSTFHIMVPMRNAPPENEMSVLFNFQSEIEIQDQDL
ncbi:MAG TPA: HAMP domain-containing sensor histidine kinase [Aggregatilineales bacterium]|nr:HAMP domain-containing sensor histidine kinase [Aggregatilineales bacterium]